MVVGGCSFVVVFWWLFCRYMSALFWYCFWAYFNLQLFGTAIASSDMNMLWASNAPPNQRSKRKPGQKRLRQHDINDDIEFRCLWFLYSPKCVPVSHPWWTVSSLHIFTNILGLSRLRSENLTLHGLQPYDLHTMSHALVLGLWSSMATLALWLYSKLSARICRLLTDVTKKAGRERERGERIAIAWLSKIGSSIVPFTTNGEKPSKIVGPVRLKYQQISFILLLKGCFEKVSFQLLSWTTLRENIFFGCNFQKVGTIECTSSVFCNCNEKRTDYDTWDLMHVGASFAFYANQRGTVTCIYLYDE